MVDVFVMADACGHVPIVAALLRRRGTGRWRLAELTNVPFHDRRTAVRSRSISRA